MLVNFTQNIEKRTLTKVRRKFLQKKDENDEHTMASPTTLIIKDNNIYILSSSTGLVEINRKIYSGPQYLNQHFNITKSFVQDHTSCKAVTLALNVNTKCQAIPWEYNMKRLESFGDLDLALWAHRIIKYTKNYRMFTENLIQLHHTDNLSEIKSRQEKLAKISEEIESTCSYYKVVNYQTLESTVVKEISYSEGLLEQMGHSIESFMKWTDNSGLPPVFDHECSVYLQLLKSVFEGSMLTLSPVNRGGEFKTILVDKQGVKKEVIVESVCLVEPAEDGVLVRGYFILKEDNQKMHPQITSEDAKASCLKQRKTESDHERQDVEKMQSETDQ